VVAAVTISRVAFPNRLTHETAFQRFLCLVDDEEKKKKNAEPLPVAVESLLGGLLENMKLKRADGSTEPAFACGKTRVYFRTGALEHLESERLVALGVYATKLERMVRGLLAKNRYVLLKRTALSCQAKARRTIHRKRFNKCKRAEIRLSAWVRMIYAQRELVRLRRERACIKLQVRFRICIATARLLLCRKSATSIQKIVRGALQRPKYKTMKTEAREEARVNTKLAALQRRLAEAEMKWMQADKQRKEAEQRAATLEAGGAVTAPVAPAAPVEPSLPLFDEEKKSEDEQTHALMDESGEMLEVLRKEVFKLRSKNYLIREDLQEQKETNQKLLEHTKSLEASLEASKQLAAQNEEARKKQQQTIAAQKKDIVDMKKSIKSKDFFHGKVVGRLQDDLKSKTANFEVKLSRLRSEVERLQKMTGEDGSNAQDSNRPRRGMSGFRGQSFKRGDAGSVGSDEQWGHDQYMSRENKGGGGGGRRRTRNNQQPPNQQGKPVSGTSSLQQKAKAFQPRSLDRGVSNRSLNSDKGGGRSGSSLLQAAAGGKPQSQPPPHPPPGYQTSSLLQAQSQMGTPRKGGSSLSAAAGGRAGPSPGRGSSLSKRASFKTRK